MSGTCRPKSTRPVAAACRYGAIYRPASMPKSRGRVSRRRRGLLHRDRVGRRKGIHESFVERLFLAPPAFTLLTLGLVALALTFHIRKHVCSPTRARARGRRAGHLAARRVSA